MMNDDEDFDEDFDQPGLQVVTVSVKLLVQPGVDVETLMENLDYEFSDEEDSIFETEIVGYEYQGEQYV